MPNVRIPEREERRLPKNESSGADGFASECCQTFREELTPILFKLFPKIAESGIIGLGEMMQDTW